MEIPNRSDFYKGCCEFEKHERRDAMYKVSTFLVSHFWGRPSDMANGLGVLLLTWNQSFYRYGSFDFDKLEKFLKENLQKIKTFRDRDISSLSSTDEEEVKSLFNKCLKALQIDLGKVKGRKSPVAVAKALHILAPNFFPIWDDKIARAYSCYYTSNPAGKYVLFCKKIQALADKVNSFMLPSDKSLLKLIDEYNYSKHTKGWI